MIYFLRAHNASVPAAIAFSHDDSGECRAAMAVDLSIVRPAPVEQFVGIDHDFLDKRELALHLSEADFRTLMPLVEIVEEVVSIIGNLEQPVPALAGEPRDRLAPNILWQLHRTPRQFSGAA